MSESTEPGLLVSCAAVPGELVKKQLPDPVQSDGIESSRLRPEFYLHRPAPHVALNFLTPRTLLVLEPARLTPSCPFSNLS